MDQKKKAALAPHDGVSCIKIPWVGLATQGVKELLLQDYRFQRPPRCVC